MRHAGVCAATVRNARHLCVRPHHRTQRLNGLICRGILTMPDATSDWLAAEAEYLAQLALDRDRQGDLPAKYLWHEEDTIERRAYRKFLERTHA